MGLGELLTGGQKASGSIQLISTKKKTCFRKKQVFCFFNFKCILNYIIMSGFQNLRPYLSVDLSQMEVHDGTRKSEN